MSEKAVVVCAYEDCAALGTTLACGRNHDYDFAGPGHPTPALYCDYHASVVADEGHPEYTDTCPNCGCRFGVN